MVLGLTEWWRMIRDPAGKRLARKLRVGRGSGRAIELDNQEFAVLFDRITRKQLGISADEFIKMMNEDRLPDSEIAEYLAQLAGGRATS